MVRRVKPCIVYQDVADRTGDRVNFGVKRLISTAPVVKPGFVATDQVAGSLIEESRPLCFLQMATSFCSCYSGTLNPPPSLVLHHVTHRPWVS